MRLLVLAALALSLGGCAASRPDTLVVPVVAQETAVLRSGPMLGYVTHRTATVWVQTDQPAEVSIQFYANGLDSTANSIVRLRRTPPVHAGPEGDHIALFTLADLEPGTRYTYSVLLDGVPAERPYPTAFTTQPLWQYRTDPPAFTVALGSCAYVNETAYDRPGTPYGGGYEIFEAVRARQPDLMLWLGDNTYLREVDWWSEAGIAHRYAHSRALPEMQALLAAQPNVAIWDDHDFGPNDADGSYILKGATLDAFRRYWANPTYGLPGLPGAFTHLQFRDVEFFLLDDRYYRSPNHAPDSPDKALLGPAQLDWLVDALTASRAPFKLVAIGGQVLNPTPIYETYVNVAPAERQRLLDALEERRVEGVVFLTGDRHHTELIRMERDGAYPLYDFTNSPLTAGAANPARPGSPEVDNPLRVPGTLVAEQRNFGTLTVEGPRTERVMTLRTFAADGSMLWGHVIPAASLRYPSDDGE